MSGAKLGPGGSESLPFLPLGTVAIQLCNGIVYPLCPLPELGPRKTR